MTDESSRIFPLNDKNDDDEDETEDVRDFLRSPHVWFEFRVRVEFGIWEIGELMNTSNC